MQKLGEAIRTTLAENTGPFEDSAARSHEKFSIDEVPDLSGKVFVVTGGSEGIGYACVHTYLNKNAAKVFVISSSAEVAQGMKDEIEKDLGKEKLNRLVWLEADLSDWTRVTQLAGDIAHQTDRLDGLVLNAARGIMTAQLTDLGVDRHMAINHIAHVILTSHLLPIIKKTAEKDIVRISVQASNLHEGAPKETKFASLEEINKDVGPNDQYGRSKLANLLYARYLAAHLSKENPNIKANATHPGFVETKMSKYDIMEPFPVAGHLMKDFPIPLLKKDQWKGAIPTLFATTVTEQTGEYVCPPVIREPGSSLAQDAQLGEQLMALTTQLVQDKTNAKEQGCPLKVSLSVV